MNGFVQIDLIKWLRFLIVLCTHKTKFLKVNILSVIFRLFWMFQLSLIIFLTILLTAKSITFFNG